LHHFSLLRTVRTTCCSEDDVLEHKFVNAARFLPLPPTNPAQLFASFLAAADRGDDVLEHKFVSSFATFSFG
jgi:hypothetical protein